MKNINGPLKVGIGGPVGAGKTSLTAELLSLIHISEPTRHVDILLFQLL